MSDEIAKARWNWGFLCGPVKYELPLREVWGSYQPPDTF